MYKWHIAARGVPSEEIREKREKNRWKSALADFFIFILNLGLSGDGNLSPRVILSGAKYHGVVFCVVEPSLRMVPQAGSRGRLS